MKRNEMKLLLEERFERIALLETRIDTMDQLVEGYRAREQAIFDTLTAAKQSAAKILEQANADAEQVRAEAEAIRNEADEVREQARAEAERLLAEAISTANTLKMEAERKGLELSAGVKADSERMLRDAEIIKREYEEMVDSFNAMIAERTYRQALQVVDALKEIKQKIPHEYDPTIFSKLILVFLDNELI